ncbi:MAG: hypothetical protein ACLGI6_11700 [Gammaproteobacteria bacterium]
MKARAVVLALVTMLAVLAGKGHTAPFLPRSGAEVVETLRSNGAQPQQQVLRRLRARLAAAPHDVALASELARRYIALGGRMPTRATTVTPRRPWPRGGPTPPRRPRC